AEPVRVHEGARLGQFAFEGGEPAAQGAHLVARAVAARQFARVDLAELRQDGPLEGPEGERPAAGPALRGRAGAERAPAGRAPGPAASLAALAQAPRRRVVTAARAGVLEQAGEQVAPRPRPAPVAAPPRGGLPGVLELRLGHDGGVVSGQG